MAPIPSLADFIAAPLEVIRPCAPATLILTNGGTRRRALLEGIRSSSDEYARWTRAQMMACLELVFQHGVRHIVTTALAETNFAETTQGYRDKLTQWVNWGIGGDAALAEYRRLGWRVQLIGAESWPGLEATAARLRDYSSTLDGPTVWFTVAAHQEARWERLFAALGGGTVRTRADAIRAVYGEDIPPATLLIGSGKPQVFASIVPPLLIGQMQCYWRQHLGYDLDETTLRTILYDYNYLRKTWVADKSTRDREFERVKEVWREPPVVGLGIRVGSFWFPAPIPDRSAGDEGGIDASL